MDNHIIWGLLLVTLAGLGTGTTAWPMKRIKSLHEDLYIFTFMFTGVILIPWLVILFAVPDISGLIADVGMKSLLISNLFSVGWGVANVIYLVCVIRIGAALTGAILSALGMSFGVMLPMVIKGSGLFQHAPDLMSPAGMAIMAALAVLVIGVVLISLAGFGRERQLRTQDEVVRKAQASGNFLQGLLLVIAAGALSCGISLAFVYSQDAVITAVSRQGGSEITANVAVWALGMFGGGVVNVGYAAYLISKRRNWGKLFKRKEELGFSSLVGLQFIISIVAMGKGMVLLGALGASVGFAIQQSMQILGNQLVGFAGGEWRGVYGKPRRQMYLAIAVILLAVAVLAYSNKLN